MLGLEPWQEEFLEFAVERGVLRFGEFTLKSGRRSPYFFNTGRFSSGAALGRLGEYYARALEASKLEWDMLFGPAYKGIPLACAVAVAASSRLGREVPFAFDRKEAKEHGEGGELIGAPVSGRVVIVDDVISSGGSVREAAATIRGAGGEVAGCLIALDRQEQGEGTRSAAQELSEALGAPVVSVIDLDAVERWLAGSESPVRRERVPPNALEAIRAYRRSYGAE